MRGFATCWSSRKSPEVSPWIDWERRVWEVMWWLSGSLMSVSMRPPRLGPGEVGLLFDGHFECLFLGMCLGFVWYEGGLWLFFFL